MTARREFGAAIAACVAGAGLVLLALRQGWARVDYAAPRPLPSGSIPVSGQNLLPAAGALALAALACLAAIIATRGAARRVAGVVMAGLGAWITVQVIQPVHAATVVAAASGQAVTGALGGSLPGGNSAIGGGSPLGGGLPEIGAASRAVLDSGPWRAVAVTGAVAVIAAGLLAAWRGPRWAVMSARFDRPAPQPGPGSPVPAGASVRAAPASAPAPAPAPATTPGATTTGATTTGATTTGATTAPAPAAAGSAAAPVPALAPGSAGADRRAAPAGSGGGTSPVPGGTGAAARHPESDAAALWEALDRGVDLTDITDLTDTAGGGTEPVAAPARGEEQ